MSTEQTATEPEDVSEEADRSARKWFTDLQKFVLDMGSANGQTAEKLGAESIDVPHAVAAARDSAVCTAFAAIESMARRFVVPTFRIDTTGFGRG